MKPICQADIVALQGSGASEEVLRQAKNRLDIFNRGLQLVQEIENAFSQVALGSGVGLWQAQGLDDYADAETLRRYREADEKDDWRKIPVAQLNRCNSSLSFFDAQGMQFHLPAYLVSDLRGEYKFGMAFCLTHLSEYSLGQFKALDARQRAAVRAYLEHILEDPDYEFDQEDIIRALDTYWRIPI